MPRRIALDKLEPEQQRELIVRRARGASRRELLDWLAEQGVTVTVRQLRTALTRIDRRLEASRDALTFAAALGSRANVRDATRLLMVAVAIAAARRLEAGVPDPVDLLVFAKIAEHLAKADEALAGAPEEPAVPPKKFHIPPGLVEAISEQVYGFRLTPPSSADVPAYQPNGHDP